MNQVTKPSERELRDLVNNITKNFHQTLSDSINSLMESIEEQGESGSVIYQKNHKAVAEFFYKLGYHVIIIDNYLNYDIIIEWGPNVPNKLLNYI